MSDSPTTDPPVRFGYACSIGLNVFLLTFTLLDIPLMAVAQASPLLLAGSASAVQGGLAEVPVTFAPGAAGATQLQFELAIPEPFVYVSCGTGPAAAAAGKTTACNQVGASVRAVIWGANRTPIEAGEVARLRLSIPAGTTLGNYHFLLTGIEASDASAASLPLTGAGGRITVTSSEPAPVLTVFYPRLVTADATSSTADDSQYTGIALLNLDKNPAHLRLTAFDKQGNALFGPGITNPADITIAPRQQLPLLDHEAFGAGLPSGAPVGWFKVAGDVRQVVGFFLMLNASLTILDGADASSTPLDSFVLTEIEDLGFTHLHLNNVSGESADVTIELLSSDGTARVPPARQYLEPNAAVAACLTDLFPGVTPDAMDYIRVTSDQPLAPFEYFGRPGLYVEGLNGQDAGSGGTTLYSPQYVVGGGWRSTISVVNLEASAADVTLKLIGDDGGKIGSTRRLTIPGKGKVHIADQDFFLASGGMATQGYVEVASSGPKLAGSVVFGDTEQSRFSSALPLVSTLRSSMVFSQLASNETWFTGLAILNPNDSGANAAIDVLDENGTVIASKVEAIPARQRRSALLTQFFPELIGQNRSKGYLRLNVDKGVASFALFGTNTQSVLAAVPPQGSVDSGTP